MIPMVTETLSYRKNSVIILIVIILLVSLIAIIGFVFKDFIFAKNEIFPETGTSIHLVYAPPFQIKNTKNRFYIRKVQNLIENAEKEVAQKTEGEKGWQMRGSITVDGKYYDLYLSGSSLEVGDTTYRIKQEGFLAKFKAIFDEIKNPK